MRATPPRAIPSQRTAVQRVLVLANRRAGSVARRPRVLDALERAVGSRGEVVAPETDAVVKVLGQGRAWDVDTIAVCGGDGTYMQVVTALRTVYRGATWPRLILLCGGRTNTTARNLGSSGDPARVLRRIVEDPWPTVVRRPLLRVNERVGFLFGTHMVARTMDAYESGPSTGLLGCALLGGRIVASAIRGGPFVRDLFAAEACRVEVDGEDLGLRPYRAILAGVVREAAPGFRFLYRAGEDEAFQIIGTTREPHTLRGAVPRYMAGLPVPETGLDRLARRAVVTFAQESRYTLDGDLFRATRLELAATPPVEFLVPASR